MITFQMATEQSLHWGLSQLVDPSSQPLHRDFSQVVDPSSQPLQRDLSQIVDLSKLLSQGLSQQVDLKAMVSGRKIWVNKFLHMLSRLVDPNNP